MKKKLFSMFLLGACLASSTVSVFASSVEQNVGVSPIKRWEVQTKETTIPTTTWNVSDKGKYDFSGQAAKQTLFTNYLFTGKTNYSIYVDNKKAATNNLSVTVYKSKSGLDSPIKTASVQGQYPSTISVSNLSSSDKIYVGFEAPSHFSGYIK